jgi:hypothetical protein
MDATITPLPHELTLFATLTAPTSNFEGRFFAAPAEGFLSALVALALMERSHPRDARFAIQP